MKKSRIFQKILVFALVLSMTIGVIPSGLSEVHADELTDLKEVYSDNSADLLGEGTDFFSGMPESDTENPADPADLLYLNKEKISIKSGYLFE